MPAHLVSRIAGKPFNSETLRIGDLNGDGAPDLLLAQSLFGNRQIQCLTALTIDGRVLWQWGAPSFENGRVYSDLPVQIHDFDGDGHNEVLLVRQAVYAESTPWGGYARERAERYEGDATMLVLDAATGQEKTSFKLPAPADDCFLFADLTGQGARRDLVVKDRYWNMWGVANDGRVLWHYAGSTGHYPAIADVDGDGRDEVFIGFALIDHDGRVVFQHDARQEHQDAACLVQLDGSETRSANPGGGGGGGGWRMVFGNGGLHCLASDGRELWGRPMAEAQHVVPGRYRRDSEVQFMVINRGQPRAGGGRDPGVLALFDLDGRELWRRPQPQGSWAAMTTCINWLGQGQCDCALVHRRGDAQPAAIYDGNGDLIDELPLPPPAPIEPSDWISQRYGPPAYLGLAADVWGDSRQEAILFGAPGLYIYANARPQAIPTHYNETQYVGS